MKKSFFLLTAALVAIFSFSACSDDKDDSPNIKACDMSETMSICIEGYGPGYQDAKELKEECDIGGGIIKNKCPTAALTCPFPTDKDGDTETYYIYEPAAAEFGGQCPDDPEDIWDLMPEPSNARVVCNYLQLPLPGGMCWEANGISSNTELLATRYYCLSGEAETLGPGTLVDECPNGADLECTKDGVKSYYYGTVATIMGERGCPN